MTGANWKAVTVPYHKHWVYSKENMDAHIADNRIHFGKSNEAFPRKKTISFRSATRFELLNTWWKLAEKFGHNQEAKREVKVFNEEEIFGTPKPERLLYRVIQLASNTGDWVLDSFAGSGTTGAVAHKMGRRWIMVELGQHCHTHIIPRMKKVIDGTDQGGITKAVGWKGGGGFRYFRLAPSLLEKDKWGNWVISKDYNATMLANAMAKHEGFVYNPDDTFYWKQGKSTEKDYIFTTTNFITVEYLDSIHEEMQPYESLLICCNFFQEACEGRYENITVKKIPNMLLGRCEFGKEDYSLNISNAPLTPNDVPYEDVSAIENVGANKEKEIFSKRVSPAFSKNMEDK